MNLPTTASGLRVLSAVSCALVLSSPVVAAAAGEQAAGSVAAPLAVPSISGLLLNLALVIGAIVVFGWVYARAQGHNRGQSDAIKVLASQALGTKERIVLIEVGGKQLVVGATAQQIQTLHEFESPAVDSKAGTLPVAGKFAERLMAAMKGGRS